MGTRYDTAEIIRAFLMAHMAQDTVTVDGLYKAFQDGLFGAPQLSFQAFSEGFDVLIAQGWVKQVVDKHSGTIFWKIN
jgi:hypothetical protein